MLVSKCVLLKSGSISGPPPFFYLKLHQIILLLSFLIGKLYCYTGVHNQISCWPARFLTPLVRYWSLQCLKYWLAYFECFVRVGVCIARDACSQLETACRNLSHHPPREIYLSPQDWQQMTLTR